MLVGVVVEICLGIWAVVLIQLGDLDGSEVWAGMLAGVGSGIWGGILVGVVVGSGVWAEMVVQFGSCTCSGMFVGVVVESEI